MLSVTRKRYLELASETYAEQLAANARDDRLAGARSYLSDHAVNYATAQKYRLGFVLEPLQGDDRFAGMLSIPYLSPAGVCAMQFRAFSGGGAKYAQPNGQEKRLYNAAAYFDADSTLGIAEGEMDAITATEHLGIPTLGVPSVTAWKDHWVFNTRDFTEVLIFADGDQPGRDFAYGLAEKVGWRARVVRCPDGEDVSSMVASGRAADLRALISTSKEV